MKLKTCLGGLILSLLFVLIIPGSLTIGEMEKGTTRIKFAVSFPRDAHAGLVTGRVYVIISQDNHIEPRFQVNAGGVPLFGHDVVQMNPEETVVIDNEAFGYPLRSIEDIPAGDYFVQGFVNIYTEFKRSDGHTLWLHRDQWEGQKWNRSPGNLYSDVQKFRVDLSQGQRLDLDCRHVIPPVQIPPDTKWVKRVKFQSKTLSEFWGQPMYLGATILLPKDYHNSPDRLYPVIYVQGHFSLKAPFGFTLDEPEEGDFWAMRGAELARFWTSEDCPRMIAVTFQHPYPYYDDSYAVNSPNVGPFGDAIMQELIPYVEERFRIIPEPYARVLSGGSTGGWIALALQIFYPDFFGGVFSLCPDPVDFHFFQCIDIYKDKNAFFKDFGWRRVPTASDRNTDGIVTLTSQQRNHYELALGTKNRSGEQIDIFEAAYGPCGPDGNVKPLFDKLTGEIDPEVAEYWKEHYDLSHILERDWARIGPQLVGKIHIYTGDMDTFYLNNAVVLMEKFLEQTTDPFYAGTVEYGDREPHCWGPPGPELIKLIAGHIEKSQNLSGRSTGLN